MQNDVGISTSLLITDPAWYNKCHEPESLLQEQKRWTVFLLVVSYIK